MNLHCPTCGRFFCEVDEPKFNTIRFKCAVCRDNITFERQGEQLVAVRPASKPDKPRAAALRPAVV